jgi:hypothetical protein
MLLYEKEIWGVQIISGLEIMKLSWISWVTLDEITNALEDKSRGNFIRREDSVTTKTSTGVTQS